MSDTSSRKGRLQFSNLPCRPYGRSTELLGVDGERANLIVGLAQNCSEVGVCLLELHVGLYGIGNAAFEQIDRRKQRTDLRIRSKAHAEKPSRCGLASALCIQSHQIVFQTFHAHLQLLYGFGSCCSECRTALLFAEVVV